MNYERSAKNQYFLDLADLNGRTDVIEFMKGKFDGKYYHADAKYIGIYEVASLGMFIPFRAVYPHYDEYCDVEISPQQWDTIVNAAKECSNVVQDMLIELNDWMTEALNEYGCVSVLGV